MTCYCATKMEKCPLLFTACKYKCFDSTLQGAEGRRQKFHFCPLPFAVNVMLNLSNDEACFVEMRDDVL